jgi:serine phosphatase RsbU (regulator of sigma subunit)
MADPTLGRESGRILESEVQMLLDVTRRIHAEANAQAVLEAIVDSLVALTRADRGFLLLKDEPKGELEIRIARDAQRRPLDVKKSRISRGVVNEVAATGRTRLIDDAAAADGYQARMSIISLSLRTILCTPLRSADATVGVIYVDSNAITRRFTDADVPLVEAFAAQASAAFERIRRQQAETERDRMRSQLEVAAEIQRTFLPGTFPTIEGVRGAVASVPALEVGGDFYDVVRLPEGRVGVMVGDVSGKGVPGALFGARLLSDVRYEALFRDDVRATVEAVNRIVCERAMRGMFVTFLYAVLDPASGTVEFANAGHLYPVVRRADGALEAWQKPSGIPLGIVPDTTYETATRPLQRGDTLVLLTDGLEDAIGESGERFEHTRVEGTIRGAPGDPAGIVSALCRATAAFTGHRPQADDQTLLAVGLA